jgi:hypothetical protein
MWVYELPMNKMFKVSDGAASTVFPNSVKTRKENNLESVLIFMEYYSSLIFLALISIP